MFPCHQRCHFSHKILCTYFELIVCMATKLWIKLWGVKIWKSMRGMWGVFWDGWGYTLASIFEFLLKPVILLENKIFMLQSILYGMFILYNVYYKCSQQTIFLKWWLFWILTRFLMNERVMIGERGNEG